MKTVLEGVRVSVLSTSNVLPEDAAIHVPFTKHKSFKSDGSLSWSHVSDAPLTRRQNERSDLRQEDFCPYLLFQQVVGVFIILEDAEVFCCG